MQVVTAWFRRHFSDPQIIFLAVALLIVFAVILTMGRMLAPVLASIVVAYLLEGPVGWLQRRRWPRLAAVLLVYAVFVLSLILVLFGILPLASRQVAELIHQLPTMINEAQNALLRLPDRYPEYITVAQVQELIGTIRDELITHGQKMLSWSLSSVVGILAILVYLILMPLLVFFFLKDKDLILDWFRRYLPQHRRIAWDVWRDVDRQISNYVRGKFWQILIVWLVSFATFSAFELHYAMLLALLVGTFVIIPYVGAAVATAPVLLIAWFQWGWSPTFIWLTVAYFVIQALDGNLLVPLLFSEVVDLHPVAIIVAILVFGGLWGFWGVFFAIPLATLVQAILSAWPRHQAPDSKPETVAHAEAD